MIAIRVMSLIGIVLVIVFGYLLITLQKTQYSKRRQLNMPIASNHAASISDMSNAVEALVSKQIDSNE